MACYAAFLATGQTIRQKSIKASTIDNYLYAAAGFFQLFDRRQRDPRKEVGAYLLCGLVKKVTNEVKRFENVPNRREPYTVKMQKYILTGRKG